MIIPTSRSTRIAASQIFSPTQGFRVIDCQPRFLPLTVKSALPVWPILLRLYLALPFKPLGKQMLIRAVADY